MIKGLFYTRFFSFNEFDIYFETSEEALNILNDIKLFRFHIKNFFLFKIFSFTPSNSLFFIFFIDLFILIISHIEISVIFSVNLDLINYNRQLNQSKIGSRTLDYITLRVLRKDNKTISGAY